MIHEETSALLEYLLRMLKEEGEENTFAYIRRLKKGKETFPGYGGKQEKGRTA